MEDLYQTAFNLASLACLFLTVIRDAIPNGWFGKFLPIGGKEITQIGFVFALTFILAELVTFFVNQ